MFPDIARVCAQGQASEPIGCLDAGADERAAGADSWPNEVSASSVRASSTAQSAARSAAQSAAQSASQAGRAAQAAATIASHGPNVTFNVSSSLTPEQARGLTVDLNKC